MTYVSQSSEMTEEEDRRYMAGIRKLSPLERLRIADRASRDLHRLMVAGLRLQYPSASEEELFRRAGARRLGRELTLRVYGPEAEAWLD